MKSLLLALLLFALCFLGTHARKGRSRLGKMRIRRRCPDRTFLASSAAPNEPGLSFELDGNLVEGDLVPTPLPVFSPDAVLATLDESGNEISQALPPELRPETFVTETPERTILTTVSSQDEDFSALVLDKNTHKWTQIYSESMTDKQPVQALSRVVDSGEVEHLGLECAEPLVPAEPASLSEFWQSYGTHTLDSSGMNHEVVLDANLKAGCDLPSPFFASDVPETAEAEVPPANGPFPTPWTPCYQSSPADTSIRKVFLGVAVDVGVYTSLGSSLTNVINFVTSAVSQTNYIFSNQLRMYLTVRKLTVQQSANNFGWNLNHPSAPCPSIDFALNNFTSWKASLAGSGNQMALWHLFSSCFQPPGVVGLAWVGTLCSARYGTGVSSVFDGAWLTFAHEVGHNFGGLHAWGSDSSQVGKVGGIMDYGDGKYQGIYQFHPVNQPQICNTLSQVLGGKCAGGPTGCYPLGSCFEASSPRCGDGLVTSPGEECDEGDGVNGGPNSCCASDCKFKPETQCISGECCLNCRYKDTSQRCGSNKQGYCSNGECKASTCSRYGLPYCGVKSDNSCVTTCVMCSPQPCSTCSDMKGATDSSTKQPLNMSVPWGSVCIRPDKILGSCQADKCT